MHRRHHRLGWHLSSGAAAATEVVVARREVRVGRAAEILRIVLWHWHGRLLLLRVVVRVRQTLALHVVVQSHLTGIAGLISNVALLG